MRIRIGNQTSFSAVTILQPFEYAVFHGFDAFEWFPDKKISGEGWSEEDMTKDDRALIKETAAANDIALSVHISSRINRFRQESTEILKDNVLFARDIGARLLNVHYYPEEGISAYCESIKPLMEILADSSIRLSVENTIAVTPEDFNGLFKYLRDAKFPYRASIGACLDIGHANLCGPTRNDYLRYVDSLDPAVPIFHIHMHENYGDNDSHLTVFTGPARDDPSGIKGLMDRVSKRGFSGSIILEQWPQPPDILVEARNRLLEIIRKS